MDYNKVRNALGAAALLSFAGIFGAVGVSFKLVGNDDPTPSAETSKQVTQKNFSDFIAAVEKVERLRENTVLDDSRSAKADLMGQAEKTVREALLDRNLSEEDLQKVKERVEQPLRQRFGIQTERYPIVNLHGSQFRNECLIDIPPAVPEKADAVLACMHTKQNLALAKYGSVPAALLFISFGLVILIDRRKEEELEGKKKKALELEEKKENPKAPLLKPAQPAVRKLRTRL